GRAVQVLRSAREDGPMHQVAHRLRLDAAVTEHLVGTGVVGDHAIEHTRLRIAIELDEELSFFHDNTHAMKTVILWYPRSHAQSVGTRRDATCQSFAIAASCRASSLSPRRSSTFLTPSSIIFSSLLMAMNCQPSSMRACASSGLKQ